MMPDQQKRLFGTGCCKFTMATKESTQARYEDVPCDLSDADNEEFDLDL